MSADAGSVAVRAGISPIARIYGFGTIFAKGIRDSRWVVIGLGIALGLITMATAYAVADQFNTAALREILATQASEIPLFRGLLGEPIAVGTLGGLLSWRIIGFMPVIVGIWSVVALSGTLMSEATRGSLEFLAATPISRRSIAMQKAAVHLVGMAIAMTIVALLTWFATAAFGSLPGDAVSLGASFGAALWIGLMALAAGCVAFALGPFVGRTTAAGVGSVVLFASYIVNGYRDQVAGFDILARLSIFNWTAGHRPLAGVSDWPSVGLLAAFCLAFLALGVVAFVRRDIGSSVSVGIALPRLRIGLRGPAGRSFGERLPVSSAWAIGIGLYGLLIATSAGTFAESLGKIPGMTEMISRFYPGVDFQSASGVLQLSFFGFGLLLFAIMAATLVSGWASDEGNRRLEVVLSAPLTRFRWGLASGLGLMAAIAVATLVVATLVAAGALLGGNEATTPFVGTWIAGAYAAALAGIGVAVGGVVRAGIAAGVVGALAIGLYLLELLGAILQLPDWLTDLSPVAHLGQPMAGLFDVPGTILCIGLAVGGVIVSAVGLSRRDLTG